MAVAFALVACAAALLAVAWLAATPTPEALYRARCASCHALPDLCAYAPARRAAIVAAMRTEQGAAALISDAEARVIADYLREGPVCP